VTTLYELTDMPLLSPTDSVSLGRYDTKVLLIYNAAAL
jgi:hypothetical protein